MGVLLGPTLIGRERFDAKGRSRRVASPVGAGKPARPTLGRAGVVLAHDHGAYLSAPACVGRRVDCALVGHRFLII